MGRKFIVTDLGTIENGVTNYIDFAIKAPAYCKKLVAATLFSPELYSAEGDVFNVELSIWMNNRRNEVGNELFILGRNDVDDHTPRHMIINQPVFPNNEITGFVKWLSGATAFNVKLYLEFETE